VYSPSWKVIQNRYFVDVQWDHDLLPMFDDILPKWVSTLDYTLNYRGEYEGIYDFGPSQYSRAEETQNNLLAFLRQSPTYEPAQEAQLGDMTYFVRHRLRQVGSYRNRLFQAFADVELGDFFLRVGRQNLVWGETDVFRLLDNINPVDNSFGGFFIDLDERLITRPGAAPAVFRTPDAVRVAPKGLGWSLRLDGDHPLVLLRHVPRGSGPALADAAEALAEALEVRARVPAAARRARGLVPRDEDLWATLCYAPIDGVNVAYSVLALMTSPSPALRFAAKQSLVSLGVELFFALLLGGCLGVPVIAASAPLALEAAALLCPLAVFTIVRVTIRLVASFHAYRGRAWVMPWLSPITRRWAPDDLRSSDR